MWTRVGLVLGRQAWTKKAGNGSHCSISLSPQADTRLQPVASPMANLDSASRHGNLLLFGLLVYALIPPEVQL